jgi:hypothetical protein
VRPALVVIFLVSALSACGGESAAESAPSELTGVIVQVDGTGNDVTAFTLEVGADRYRIFIAEDVDYGFDLRHLHEHRLTGDPVRCTLEERDDRLYALEILDAET